MLQQILRDMYIDPELLAELSEEQKQILFVKMREEQIRRYEEREKEQERKEQLFPATKRPSGKKVQFCEKNGELSVDIIPDEMISSEERKKKEEAEALRKAEELAKKEAEEEFKKKWAEQEAHRLEEEKKIKEEEERIAREKAAMEEELKKKQEEAALFVSIREAKLQAQKAEEERKELEQRMREAEEKKQQALKALQEKEERERRLKEQELVELERKRKEELYANMKKAREEKLRQEREEQELLEKEWEEREQKARNAERERRDSFNQAHEELKRLAKLAKERQLLEAFREDQTETNEGKEENALNPRTEGVNSVVKGESCPPKSKNKWVRRLSGGRKLKEITKEAPKSPNLNTKGGPRPSIPAKPVISSPVPISQTSAIESVPIKKPIAKPSRPPPPASKPKMGAVPVKLPRPPRPRSRSAVAQWWRDVEFEKGTGLDENGLPKEWFHGIISRTEAEEVLNGKVKGTFLVRVSERVWGYTISYKDADRCKHFLVDTSGDTYQFFGTQQIAHATLNDLVEFHKTKPVSGIGQEYLVFPCGQAKEPPDYCELFIENTPI